MSWFARFLGPLQHAAAALDARQEQVLADWRQLPEADQRRSHYRSRYVVIDVEVSSSDAHTARLLALAAVAVVDGQIAFRDAWQLLLPDAAPAAASSPPVCATAAPADAPMVDGLLSFLGFVGKAPVVAYNARFIRRVMQRALAEYLGVRLRLPWLDMAWILPDLFREVDAGPERLDAWLEHFGIASIKRHDALSDAFATAQLLQIAMAHAASKGFDTPASLHDLEKARRHLHQSA
ncbi:MAG: DNA polymerase III PolC-type [Candidatus Accumulibacter sp. BA-94]|uniref:3'-5' exonuclease n=1 Tax=Accumulibacter sp. TaxID=2053492 RepID=UPI000446F327|nr:3'-5' exonuclease [Accumulibacter sp.]EXI91584.1 MAG: DNA polymerase III PolC-type [Candidatus Accumulibacter sp. BA-94]HRD86860.1 3'-5' exonuclease [Accumulibacter sp.]